jgi:hypothetical protein
MVLERSHNKKYKILRLQNGRLFKKISQKNKFDSNISKKIFHH